MKIIGGNNVLLAGRGGSIWQRGGSTPPIITATQAPTGHAYTEGNTLGSHPSYATLNNTTNYTSTAGTISSVEWLVNGVAQASGFVVTAGEAVSLRVTDSLANTRTWSIDPSIDATVPAQFAAGNWSVTNTDGTVRIVISALPDDGGSAITDIEYRVNAGAAVSLSGSTTGTYVTLASAANNLEIRAVNATGAGAWSASKAAPADPAAPTIPGVPNITGASTVGSTLTAVASTPVTGNPTPTRTWEWYWVGNPTSFASGETYVIQAGDVGKEAYVRQIETNSEGTATADSTATPAITAGNFDPANLYSSGELGGFWKVDPEHCWQDTAGTIPAGVGDPVARVDDLSPNANHLLQPTTASQPVLQADADPAQTTDVAINGTFDTDISGWTVQGANASWNAGQLQMETTATVALASQWHTVEVGSRVELTVYMQRYGGANQAGIFLYDTGTGSNVLLDWVVDPGSGVYTVSGYAASNQIRASLRSYGAKNAGQGCYFDNVQIKVTPPSGLSYYLDFDGVDDQFDMTGSPFGGAHSAYSVVAAYQYDTVSDFDTVFAMTTADYGNGSEQFFLLRGESTPNDQIMARNNGVTHTNGQARAADTPYAFVYRNQSGSQQGWVNGTQVAERTRPWNPTTMNYWSVGCMGGNNSLAMNGRIYGLVLIDRHLSDTERTDSEAWAADLNGATIA